MGRQAGLREEQLLALPDYETSPELSALEKLVISYAVAMTRTPATVSDELFAELRKHFDESQLVELTGAIAWENYRARFNRAFAIQSQHFSEGSVCVLPELGAHSAEGKSVASGQA